MSNYNNRLDRLEALFLPEASTKFVMAFMNYDDHGCAASIELRGQRFTPMPDESEDALCDRAMREVGRGDQMMLIRWIKPSPNGGLAPGFERFAK